MGEQKIEVAPVPETGDRRILTLEPPNLEAPPGAFAHLVTPAEKRFLRCHFPIPALAADPLLEIGGAVVEPRLLAVSELRALPPVTITVVTECAGNGRGTFQQPVDGERWGIRAVGAAQWSGTPLRTLIELKETAVEVVFTGADGGGEYQRSLPREAALDPDTLLAWEMNGEPIPSQFGGPLRLVVPGWYGMASVKWLARIEAVEHPFSGRFQTERYVYGPGDPVTRVRIKSMFTGLPESLRARAPVRIAGLAWGGEGVARVEVSISGAWRDARLAGPVLPHAWRRFEVGWTPPAPGVYQLRCRATDVRGELQPETPRWNPLGYGANAVQQVAIAVR